MINTVKIGNQTYDVFEVECVDKHDTLAGQIKFFESEIRIQKELSIELKQETILHEVIHGIENFFGLDLEEDEVKQLGRGLTMVFKDNPKLLEYLKDVTKK
jgi:hypothetical protein